MLWLLALLLSLASDMPLLARGGIVADGATRCMERTIALSVSANARRTPSSYADNRAREDEASDDEEEARMTSARCLPSALGK